MPVSAENDLWKFPEAAIVTTMMSVNSRRISWRARSHAPPLIALSGRTRAITPSFPRLTHLRGLESRRPDLHYHFRSGSCRACVTNDDCIFFWVARLVSNAANAALPVPTRSPSKPTRTRKGRIHDHQVEFVVSNPFDQVLHFIFATAAYAGGRLENRILTVLRQQVE